MSKYSRDLTILLNMRKYCRYITQNLSKIENGFEELRQHHYIEIAYQWKYNK